MAREFRGAGPGREPAAGEAPALCGERERRRVDPLRIESVDQDWYLRGWDHLRTAIRTFRLDRIDAVTTLEATRARSDEPPLDLSDGLFSAGPDDVEVRLAVAPRARWVADYYPVTAVAESADGGLEVTLAASDERWLIRLVLGLAPHVRILAPASLATAVSDRARAALAHYER